MADKDLEKKLIGTWTCFRWNEKRGILALQQDRTFSLLFDSDSAIKRLLLAINVRRYEGVWEVHEKSNDVDHPHVILRQRRADAPLFKPTLNPLIALSSTQRPITFDITNITANEVTLRDSLFSNDYGNRWVRL